MRKQTVVVIGAGPYGLSTAAHLRHAGVEPYVIGQPMGFWKHNMPGKMLLRSRHEASNIAAPRKHLSLEAYQTTIRRRLNEPLPIEDFIAYGEWFHKQVVPRLDTRNVRNVAPTGGGFEIAFEDGEKLHAESVVLALGIGLFAQRPEQFAGIPRVLASHSSEFSNLTQFRGKRVAVIGRGQSALEYAAILHESSAEVQILTRSETVNFLPFAWRKHLFRRLTPGPLRPLSWRILPPTDLGDIRTARKMADPVKFRRQSPEVQQALLKDVTTPRGAYWLPSRLQGVPVKAGVSVTSVERAGDALKLTLSDGSTDLVHLAVLATGYRIDISKYHILDDCLKQAIQKTADGYPVLATNLQTSVKGLYMAGVVAERILGPTLRFVTGTSNAGPCLAAALTGKRSTH
ncbi:MAG: FAD-dependent oxidoreductase [Bryobacterales bacterium]|nr:FAD-dependent oxidoreductase [Bryobacterales bacterium]